MSWLEYMRREDVVLIEEDIREKNEDCLSKMKLGKVAGHDGIIPEMLKYMGSEDENLFKIEACLW